MRKKEIIEKASLFGNTYKLNSSLSVQYVDLYYYYGTVTVIGIIKKYII